jgi:hypothetical protein
LHLKTVDFNAPLQTTNKRTCQSSTKVKATPPRALSAHH